MASNVMQYVTANWHTCNSALVACCEIFDLNTDVVGPRSPAALVAPGASFVPFWPEKCGEEGTIVDDEASILLC